MAEQTARKKLVVIDGKSVFYRGYYAMPNLSTKDGTPTGGVYGFAAMALEVLRRLNPDYVCVAWDKPKTNIRKRKEIYPDYKANRKPAPPDFYEQVPILHRLLEAFSWPLYELDDYEADDIMGTLARKAGKEGLDTVLVTSDLDLLQVVNEHTKVYAMKTGFSNIELFSPESFAAKYGIAVDQFLDLKALKGDSSDNIPGVPGVGEKTAAALLQEHKTLDGVYENIDLVKESVRKKLVAGKDSAYMSKKIAAIWTDAPVDLDLKALSVADCKPDVVLSILQELEFRSLVRQLPEVMKADGSEHVATEAADALGKIGAIEVVDTKTAMQKLSFAKADALYVQARSAGAHGQRPQLLLISADPTKVVYALDLAKLDHAAVATFLDAYASTPIVGHDTKSTLQAYLALGAKLPSVGHDVHVGAFLVNSLRREQSLGQLAGADLGLQDNKLDELSTDDLQQRGAEVLAVVAALHKQQLKQLKDLPDVATLAADVEWPVIRVLAQMEYLGMQLDTDYLRAFADEVADMISDIEQQIYGLADQEFNIASPSQLAKVLYEDLGLPTQGVKRGKTGYSTAASELDKLRGQHDIIDHISRYREVTKLKNTYIDPLPKMVDGNSRLHTTFNLTVAQTGRLSSNDPNLQNIPVRTDLGKRIRRAFESAEGTVFVQADYSQFELRLAAYLSDDKRLIEAFNNDVDVHTATAALVHDRKPEDITKNMRRDAKVVNFGVLYGMSTHGLVAATGMSYVEAKKFIERFFEVRPKLHTYVEQLKEHAKEDGYVQTLFGRRRPTPDVRSSNFAVREAAFRAAVNMPFQGSAADIMKLAMVHVDKTLSKLDYPVSILLQIHDSLMVECPEEKADEVAKLMKDTMEAVVDLPIKLTVDTTTGQNWGEL